MAVKPITGETFAAEVLQADQPVLVDFWAPRCGPCLMLAPVVEELSDETPNVKFVKLNVDENTATAIQYQVSAIPTLMLFKGGTVANKMLGVQPKDAIRNLLQ